MDFDLPPDLAEYLRILDRFIEAEIRPLEEADDNIRFFDHRREHARTDWDKGSWPLPLCASEGAWRTRWREPCYGGHT
jgi:acyl-CoA dehydrogenase